VALVDHRDKWHTTAKAIFSKLDNLEFVPIYFDCVMNESFSILGRRAEEQKRLQDVPSMFSDLTAFAPKQEMTWVSKETERLYDDIVKLVNLDFAQISQISCFVFGDFSFLSPKNAKCEVKIRTNR